MRKCITKTIDTITAVFTKRTDGTMAIDLTLKALRAGSVARSLGNWLVNQRIAGLPATLMCRLQPAAACAARERGHYCPANPRSRQGRRPLGRGASASEI